MQTRRMPDNYLHADLTRQIIGAYYRVYDSLGFGYLESVYKRALTIELRKRGLQVDCEVPVNVWYDGQQVGHFRVDLLVEGAVLIECKSSRALAETDREQLLNYLRSTNLEVGLIL